MSLLKTLKDYFIEQVLYSQVVILQPCKLFQNYNQLVNVKYRCHNHSAHFPLTDGRQVMYGPIRCCSNHEMDQNYLKSQLASPISKTALTWYKPEECDSEAPATNISSKNVHHWWGGMKLAQQWRHTHTITEKYNQTIIRIYLNILGNGSNIHKQAFSAGNPLTF